MCERNKSGNHCRRCTGYRLSCSARRALAAFLPAHSRWKESASCERRGEPLACSPAPSSSIYPAPRVVPLPHDSSPHSRCCCATWCHQKKEGRWGTGNNGRAACMHGRATAGNDETSRSTRPRLTGRETLRECLNGDRGAMAVQTDGGIWRVGLVRRAVCIATFPCHPAHPAHRSNI